MSSSRSKITKNKPAAQAVGQTLPNPTGVGQVLGALVEYTWKMVGYLLNPVPTAKDANNSANVSSHSSLILSLQLHCRLTSFNYLTSSPALFLVTEMGDGHTVFWWRRTMEHIWSWWRRGVNRELVV